jgi:hypothetical protein
MSNQMNILVHLNAYADNDTTNAPSLNNVKWARDIQGINVSEPNSQTISLVSGASQSLFSGSVSISADITTTYDIALKSGTTNTYVISHNGGLAPDFRIARISGADATSEVTITKNAKLLTITSSAGTLFDLIVNGVIVGDEARIGSAFNVANQGTFKILSRTATAFVIENENGIAESGIILGADFASDINIYSSDGVQIGDKIDIVAGFSSVSFGTYEITDVSHDYLEFYSLASLPSETGISNNPDAFNIYRNAKQFIYIESDQKINITINGASIVNQIVPIVVGSAVKPGIFMNNAIIKSVSLENKSTETANIFIVTAE